MKVLVFGVGKFYQNRKERLRQNAEIVAFVDNNQRVVGTFVEGIPVISPYDIKKYTYDKILLMSVKANDMKRQLIELGIEKRKIMYWEEFSKSRMKGCFEFYCGDKKIAKKRKKVLIISTGLAYNGGTLAAVYAGMELQRRGYNVILAAAIGDEKFIDEIVGKGMNIIICKTFPYVYTEEIYFIQQFDIVLVNTFQMLGCVCEISKIKPIVWWIHEPSMLYEDTILQYEEDLYDVDLERINVYAVSGIPQNNFNQYFHNKIKETLEYGIPDKNNGNMCVEKEKKIVFAIIGVVCQRKAQDIFINAITLLENKDRMNAVFKIIGTIGEDDYSNKIKRFVSKDTTVQILGELTQDEIDKAYKDIDVVVCPSLEDPLPIVMTEGMMYGKVCITSDANGTVDYIEDGKNGLICKRGNPIDLSKKMSWVINNKDRLQEMGRQARKTYEKYFTLKKFGDRLERVLLEAIDQYKTSEN